MKCKTSKLFPITDSFSCRLEHTPPLGWSVSISARRPPPRTPSPELISPRRHISPEYRRFEQSSTSPRGSVEHFSIKRKYGLICLASDEFQGAIENIEIHIFQCVWAWHYHNDLIPCSDTTSPIWHDAYDSARLSRRDSSDRAAAAARLGVAADLRRRQLSPHSWTTIRERTEVTFLIASTMNIAVQVCILHVFRQ